MLQPVFDFLRESHGGWSLVLVFIAAMLEYLVPPLPADSVVLVSSLLIVAGLYPFWLVFVVAVGGGFVGSLLHFMLGRALHRMPERLGARLFDRVFGRGGLDRFLAALRKYGMWVMALNRALPGVRGVCFIAAGWAGLPPGRTLAFGLISNLAWTFLILGLGTSVGGQWEKIEAAQGVYRSIMYIVAGAALVLYIGYRVVRRVRRGPTHQDPVDEGPRRGDH